MNTFLINRLFKGNIDVLWSWYVRVALKMLMKIYFKIYFNLILSKEIKVIHYQMFKVTKCQINIISAIFITIKILIWKNNVQVGVIMLTNAMHKLDLIASTIFECTGVLVSAFWRWYGWPERGKFKKNAD